MKKTLAFIFVIVFLVFLLQAYLLSPFLKYSINTFSNLEVTDIQKTKIGLRFIHFDLLDFNYDGIALKLENTKIQFRYEDCFSLQCLEIDSIKIANLHIAFADTDSVIEADDFISINIEELLPMTLYKHFPLSQLSVQSLSIENALIKDSFLEIEALEIIKSEPNRTLSINALIHDTRSTQDFQLGSILSADNNSIVIDLQENKNTFINTSFSFENNNDSVDLISTIHISNISTVSNESLKSYLPDGMDNFTISELDLSARSQLPRTLEINNSLKLDHPIASTFEIAFSSHAFLSNHEIKKISISPRIHGSLRYQNFQDFEMAAHIPGQNIATINFNSGHFQTQSKSLEYLFQYPLLIGTTNNTQIKLGPDQLSISQGLLASWSFPGNNAYAEFKLNALEQTFALPNIYNSELYTDIDYSLKGRWNRYFSLENTGSIEIESLFSDAKHDFTFKAKDSRLNASINASGKINKNNIKGHADFVIDKLQGRHINEAATYFDDSLRLSKGSLRANSFFSIVLGSENKLHHTGSLKLDSLYADYDGFLFKNMNIDGKFKGNQEYIQNDGNINVDVSEIDLGFKVTDLSMLLETDIGLSRSSRVTAKKLKAKVFDGVAQAERFDITLPYMSNQSFNYHTQFALQLDNIQLGKILELAENPEIQGKGTLQGFIPISMNQDETQITHGKLHNLGDGYIQYLPDQETQQSLKQNPQMALLISVLSHLDYQTLETDINLNASGTMLLNGKLQGVNPDYKNGYPINFNPHIELDFIDMLHSLQIGDNIDKSINKRINQKSLD